MPIRKTPLVTGEHYHCFNRGVDKRVTFIDADDFQYFLDILFLFNQLESLGDMRTYRCREKYLSLVHGKTQKLVSISSYCVNPNHFHLLLKQEVDNGITDFMRKVGTGYTMYFNKKYERTGSLFEGKFKAKHLDTDEYLKYLFSYVHLNPRTLSKEKDEYTWLCNYKYATLADYTGQVRPENKIVSKNLYQTYLPSVADVKNELYDWLEFEYAVS